MLLSNTSNLRLKDTSLRTESREFMETSPLTYKRWFIDVSPPTNNLRFKDVSPPTYKRWFIETSSCKIDFPLTTKSRPKLTS